jgi:hypothetical protein
MILNVILPLLLAPFATDTEKNACIKDENLTLKEKFMVMLLHHKHMPVMSSAGCCSQYCHRRENEDVKNITY